MNSIYPCKEKNCFIQSSYQNIYTARTVENEKYFWFITGKRWAQGDIINVFSQFIIISMIDHAQLIKFFNLTMVDHQNAKYFQPNEFGIRWLRANTLFLLLFINQGKLVSKSPGNNHFMRIVKMNCLYKLKTF